MLINFKNSILNYFHVCCITLVFTFFNLVNSQKDMHTYPDLIADEVKIALSYFPQLADIDITFKFKKDIKKSTMQAQPGFWSLLKSRKNRSYYIFISEKFKISGKEFKTIQLPSDILVGWLGHELGHIMDYQNRGKFNLIWFGVKYLIFEKHIIEAERVADSFAVSQGMEEYILKTKNFILNHADIDDNYKMRIQKYYLSPEEIMHLVENR